jgi:hypothetical protein
MKIEFLDKYGYPVERIKGRWFVNIIRVILHTKKIVRGYWNGHKIVK